MSIVTFFGYIFIVLFLLTFFLTLTVYAVAAYNYILKLEPPSWYPHVKAYWLAVFGITLMWFVFTSAVAMVTVL